MPRAGVREERLRSTVGLKGADAMTSWCGMSGRRYVVGVHEAAAPDLADVTEAVVIAVARTRDGTARVLDVAAPEPGTTRRSRQRWLSLMRTRGATELHVHLLAETAADRAAIRHDLADPVAARMSTSR